MVGKVGEIWIEEFRLILVVLAELLKPGVPAVGGNGHTEANGIWKLELMEMEAEQKLNDDIYLNGINTTLPTYDASIRTVNSS